jgi:CRP-like cAMP-binding protein
MKPEKLRKNGNGKVDSFDPQVFLDTAGVARQVADFRRGESIYSEGEAADSAMYVQKGGVKFSVVNGTGKEAVVAMFGPSDFFGEGCMAGQTIRMGPATAITPTTLLVIQKRTASCTPCRACLAPDFLDTGLSVFMPLLRVQGVAGEPGLA